MCVNSARLISLSGTILIIMQENIDEQDLSSPKEIGFLGKFLALILCLVCGVIAAHYKGTFSGIFVTVCVGGWVYFNVLKRGPKTREDILYEEQLELQRKAFNTYKSRIPYDLIVFVFVNLVVYFITRNIVLLIFVDLVFLGAWSFFISKSKNNSEVKDRITIAQELGLTFSQSGDTLFVHERLQHVGANTQISNVFSGKIESLPIAIFDFYYKWMKKTANKVTVLEITNTKNCPNMLIISKSDSFGETIKIENFFQGVKVDLEGNFSEHFDVFVESGAEDEVRQFLTPDMMVVLIDSMPELSFMFFDNKVYVVLSTAAFGFLKNDFVHQVNKVKFIISKWSLTLSKMEFST